ncbi:AMP-binding protein [Bacteroidota bacterium]
MRTYYTNLSELLAEGAARFSNNLALSIPDGISYTYKELHQLSLNVASFLFGAGVSKGDKIAIIGENSPNWVAAYFGVHKAGAIAVPILTDFSTKEMESILTHSESSVVCVSSKEIDKFKGGFPAAIKYIVTLEDLRIHPVSNLSTLLSGSKNAYEQIETADNPDHQHAFPDADKDELAVIIYTSGTTGRSKGVMLTHDNIIFDAVQTGTIHQVIESDVFLSVLPLAHTFESTIGLIVPLIYGASVYYTDRAPTASYLGPLLQRIRPTTMLTVPLIMEKIYRNKIAPGIQKSPVTRLLSRSSVTRKIIFRAAGKKLMAFFGGRMRFFGIGGAPLAPDVERFLLDAKFPYAIGYGLTETSPMLAGFAPEEAIFRSVGTVMEGVDIRIENEDPDTGEGEIVAIGRNIMIGYYKNEEATREVFTGDGYFKTGDLGLFKDGILYIKGRSKNMILGPNGENIYPEEIESVINKHQFVSESLVMQVKGKLVAKVHLNFQQLEDKFHHVLNSVEDKQNKLNEKAEEVLEDLMSVVNEQISKNSRLQVILLQVDPFEKTPTMKIKRYLYSD